MKKNCSHTAAYEDNYALRITHYELSHALILTGGTEAGREEEAKNLTAALQCDAGREAPCKICLPCRKVMGGGHPDVFFLRPEGKEIVVAQVRGLRTDLRLAPHEGRCKVAVIRADALNAHAQNALLNILEEPPERAHFLLLAENPSLLLPTVRSRCAVRRLQEPPGETDPGPEAAALMQALLSDNEWTWVQVCLSMEKRPCDELSRILDGLVLLLVRDLPERDVLTARRFGSIIDQIRTLQDMLEFNAGAGHVCGALSTAMAAARRMSN